jgi:hypothetical protein
MKDEELIQAIVQRITEAIQPQKIILLPISARQLRPHDYP